MAHARAIWKANLEGLTFLEAVSVISFMTVAVVQGPFLPFEDLTVEPNWTAKAGTFTTYLLKIASMGSIPTVATSHILNQPRHLLLRPAAAVLYLFLYRLATSQSPSHTCHQKTAVSLQFLTPQQTTARIRSHPRTLPPGSIALVGSGSWLYGLGWLTAPFMFTSDARKDSTLFDIAACATIFTTLTSKICTLVSPSKARQRLSLRLCRRRRCNCRGEQTRHAFLRKLVSRPVF
jgi:hypothetical protein